MDWLQKLDPPTQILIIGGAGLFLLALGMFFLWLASWGDEYQGVRKRTRHPKPWQRDPNTGEHLVIHTPTPVAIQDFPNFVAADTDTRLMIRHRVEDIHSDTTYIDAQTVSSARAMVVDRDKTRRALSVDWRDAWVGEDAPPSASDTGRIFVPVPRPALDRTRAWRTGGRGFIEERDSGDHTG